MRHSNDTPPYPFFPGGMVRDSRGIDALLNTIVAQVFAMLDFAYLSKNIAFMFYVL